MATLPPGEVATLALNTLGYEWNSDVDNGFRPAGLIDLSSTTLNVSEMLLDYGSSVGPGTATHSLTLYRAATAPLGKTPALVFSAGTIQWSWGLDADHPGPVSVADVRMQQATVNLFADMGVQVPAGSLQAGLVQTSASTDFTAPTSIITSPTSSSVIQTNTSVVIQGTAADSGGGVVGGVEVSTDGGTTWHPAVLGTNGWTYAWTPTLGVHTILSRATDDSLNMETPAAGVTVDVTADSVTSPQLSNLQITVIDPFTATVAWTSDEASTSVVHFGTAQDTPNSASTAGLTTNHSVTLTGLVPRTVYYFRLESSDASGNTSNLPVTSNAPQQFTTRALVVDTTVTDFAAGDTGTNTTIINQINPQDNGSVTLAPTAGAEFSGTALPANWATTIWNFGGTVAVNGGLLQVDGAAAFSSAAFNAGHSMEFMATFTSDAYQHVGFGVDLNNVPWAIFSTSGGGGLNVRTYNGTINLDTPIPGNFLGTPHLYRIDWNSSSVIYSVDGAVVATHSVTIATPMRPIASDLMTGGNNLKVDWLRMGPFAASGSYLSSVIDGGVTVMWGTTSWTAATPAGSSVTLLVRTGDTPTPDATWTSFAPLSGSGASIGVLARYLQYRADLTTGGPGDPDLVPKLNDVTIDYIFPLVTTLDSDSPVGENSPVTASFNVPNDPGDLHYSFALTPAGLAADYASAGTASSSAFTFTDNGSYTIYGRILNPDDSFTDYSTDVAVANVPPTGTLSNSGPVAANAPVTVNFSNPADVSPVDAAAGFHYSFALSPGGLAADYAAAGTSASQSFTFASSGSYAVYGRIFDKDNGFTDYTTAVVVSGKWIDTTLADFTLGTPGTGILLTDTGGGAVTLAPSAGSEFAGTSLPAGWAKTIWDAGGTAAAGGGLLLVDGAAAYTSSTFGVGRSMEFSATFTTDAYQHAGFGVDLNSAPWAIFSTGSGGGLNARTFNGTSELITPIPGNFLGSPHLYRIDWNSSNVTYSVDGTVVATHALTISSAMRPIASDLRTGGNNLQVDWMRVAPFAATGSFLSRVFDGGGTVSWGTVSWTTAAPSGTSVTLLARTGNTPTPDATWTSFVPLSGSGASIGVAARYLQYRADLTTANPGDPDLIPALYDVTINYSSATTPTLVNSGPAAESSPVAVNFSVPNDPGNLHYSFALTPGGLAADYAAAGAVNSAAFTFSDNGNYTVYGRILNPDDSFIDYTTNVDVTNVPPTATLSNSGPVAANTPVTVSFSNPADVSPTDTAAGFRYSFALSPSELATSYAAAGTSADQTITSTGGGSFTAYGRIFDKDNGFTDYTTLVIVTGQLTDTTSADFLAGTPDANTSIISQLNPLNDGAVSLIPAAGSEFPGAALPAGWASTVWHTGGAVTVSGGRLQVDGASAFPTGTFTAGRSVEFMATFTSDPYQHVGFGVDLNSGPWAIFSTGSGGGLIVRTNNGTSEQTTAISGNFLGVPHLYRIDWNSSNIVYSVDGAVVATHAATITTAMRPIISDYFTGGNTLQVDWLRLGPFAVSGSFLSRVFDGGGTVSWNTASWTGTTPSGTSMTLWVRTGDTPSPDATWTSFVPLAGSGASIGAVARYLQYRADLTTGSPGNPELIPSLDSVTMSFGPPAGFAASGNPEHQALFAAVQSAAASLPARSPFDLSPLTGMANTDVAAERNLASSPLKSPVAAIENSDAATEQAPKDIAIGMTASGEDSLESMLQQLAERHVRREFPATPGSRHDAAIASLV